MTEDEMVGWHHRLNGHEFEQTPGDSEGRGSLKCCSPWGGKVSDTTQRVNNNDCFCSSIIGYLIIINLFFVTHALLEKKVKYVFVFYGNTIHNLVHLGYLFMRGACFYYEICLQ